MIEQVIVVHFSDYRPSPEAYTIRADTGRDLVLRVVDYPLSGGMTAAVHFRLSDGTEDNIVGAIDAGMNTVTAELDDAIVDAGDVPCQLRITEDGKDLSSFTFIIRVLRR